MSDWLSSLALLWQLAAGTFIVSVAIYLINRFFYTDETLDYEQAMQESDDYLSREHGVDLQEDDYSIESPLGYLLDESDTRIPSLPALDNLQDRTVRPNTVVLKNQAHITPPEVPNPIEEEQIQTMIKPMPEPAPSITTTVPTPSTLNSDTDTSVKDIFNSDTNLPNNLQTVADKSRETATIDLESLTTDTSQAENPYGNSLSLIRGLGVSEILALGRLKIGNTKQLAACSEEQIAQHLPELGTGTNVRIKHWVKQAQLIEDGRMDALAEYQDNL